ncbi:MAG: hypothetical protein M3436_17575 [Pseudomonadota bacterium]|nr:hypothetical protein [Pseudomonadota bacterium]
MIGFVRRVWLALVLKEVPLEEYHALRWTLDAIRAGQAKTVRARMRIKPTATDRGRHTGALIAALLTGV